MSHKNPYELRLELLNLAFNILSDNYHVTSGSESQANQPPPTVEQIIAEAKKLNDFVGKDS